MREGSSPRFNVLGTILLDEIAGGLCRHGAITPGFAARQGSSVASALAKAGIELGENGSIFPRGSVVGCLVVGQQIIVPKNFEHRPNKLSLIVVADLVVPHCLSSPIRS